MDSSRPKDKGMTLEELLELLRGEGLKFFIDEAASRVMLVMVGPHGTHNLVISLLSDGRFLQIRSAGWLQCPKGHPHMETMLQALLAANYKCRFVKFAWDPKDGEIVAYGDVWIEDGSLTQRQFHSVMENYFAVIDMQRGRFDKIISTGKDPGDIEPQKVIDEMMDRLPPELRKALEDLLKGKKSDDEDI